ncbi:hypothetical protein N7462_000580 [Penicillium macrosclerotiorum]|uniref:uncharacterized protein n=1 Tax=Penicillium macrosclerotiorum TaxID=303699 RepID=UPI0025472050|nr:uncharacterized protein N7462_000580 [Penicillium macrosclerotiorum]KAJ5698575.1 hypothetical protein N7462_000580 [Penicillium macrosclerotiorum]
MNRRYKALGATYQLARIFEICSLVAVIGIVAKFISVMVSNDANPPGILIGTICVTAFATLYCILTSILYVDDKLPFLSFAVVDFLVLVGMIVVAVGMGKPLSYLDCYKLSNISDNAAVDYVFSSSSYLKSISTTINYASWIGASKAICLETKAIWGLSIALCILFFFSTICSLFLWRQKKSMIAMEKE